MSGGVHDHHFGYVDVVSDASEGLSSGNNHEGFCDGMGMVMYMDGFQLSLSSGNHSCLNLWFTGWTLNSVGKFVAAMFGVFLLGVATEGMSALRRNVAAASTVATSSRRRYYGWMQRGLYCVQGFLGYFLMLAVMTFSVELLLSCLFGVTLGYALFTDNNNTTVAHSTNPCCDFMNLTETTPSTTTDTTAVHPLLSSSPIHPTDTGSVRKRHTQPQSNNHETMADDEMGNCCSSKSS